MPRTATTAQTAALEATYYTLALKLQIADSDGTLQDRSGQLMGVDVDLDIDHPVSSATFVLRREWGATKSLSPFRVDSVINRNTYDAFAPAIAPGRLMVLSVATVAVGAAVTSSDFIELWRGTAERITWATSAMQVTARDPGGALVDAWVRVKDSVLGSVSGVPMETVIQFILDTYGPGGITLSVPMPPGYGITPYKQSIQTVADAITALQQLIGWDTRYLYDESSSTWKLTLTDPSRSKTVPDLTISPSRYINVSDLFIDRDKVRNAMDGSYTDASGAYPVPASINVSDLISQSQYGFRWLNFVEGTDSPINSEAKMLAMLNAALADLKDPKAEQEIEMHFDWRILLNDLLRFTPNGLHYDADLSGAVVQLKHRFSIAANGAVTARTVVRTRGKPCSGYLTWQDRKYEAVTFPAKPALSDRIDHATGVVDVLFDADSNSSETRVVIRTDRAPVLDEIMAGVSGGVGITTGACSAVATVAPFIKFWIGGVSLNVFGAPGEISVVPSANLGNGATAPPTVAIGTAVVQSGKISWPITFGDNATRILLFVKTDDTDPDPGTIQGADVERLVNSSNRFEYDRASSGVVNGAFTFAVPIYSNGHWITVTAVPIDALNQRGPKVSVKKQGPGVSPPSAPNKPSIMGGTPTSNSIPTTMTFPSSGTAAVKIRPYLDGSPLADVPIGAWSYNGSQPYTFVGLLPASSHSLRCSLITSGGIESPQSDAISRTCAAATGGGGGGGGGGGSGTGSNGKLVTPMVGGARYSTSAQQVLITYADSGANPDGTRIRVWSSPTSGGAYTDTGFSAALPDATVDVPQTGFAQTKYYKVTAYDPTRVYTESDLSSVITVAVPA